MRTLLIAVIALAATACSPPAATTTETAEPPAAPAPGVNDEQTQTLLNVLQPLVAAEVGQPVSLQPTTVNVRDEWAYVDADIRNGDGTEINWMTTNLASRYENGAMDTGGGVHALLKNENGTWTVLERVIAPTDVAWIDWAGEHGVPADILGLPSN
jgi:hypothetical protein